MVHLVDEINAMRYKADMLIGIAYTLKLALYAENLQQFSDVAQVIEDMVFEICKTLEEVNDHSNNPD